MQKIVFLLTISGLVCCQPSSPLQNQVHRFQNKTTGTAVNMELAVQLLNNSSTEKLPLVPIMDIKPLVPQEEKNSSLNGTTGRNGRQLGVITRGISNQLMEGVDGIDLSSWFSYMKGMWRWMTSGAGGASSESLKVTNEMSSLTSSFIEGQIREIAENQTQILSQLESDEEQQGSDNFSVGVGLSIASPTHHTSRYMADQTFHTPNFGDEEFDIPPINLPQDGGQHQGNMQYSMPMGHGGPNDQQQQQHHYGSMYLPEHMSPPITIHSPITYGGSPPTYTTLSSPHSGSQQQQSPMGNQHMMHHPQGNRGQQQNSMVPPNAPPGRSPTNSNPSPANPEAPTSDDSDDSVPVAQLTTGMKRPSPEPVDSRSVAGPPAAVKKPKAQKKKKKRDPNEPQKPVSAYALFFRDTQAAIKGQNPNASFGEVSKIVASMWDALDADHKNVYKKKTEAAKKDYLKALAAYRASLVSKGASPDSADGSGMYPPSFNTNMPAQQHYTPHTQNQNYYNNQGGPGSHASPANSQQKKGQAQQQQQANVQGNNPVGVQPGMQSQQSSQQSQQQNQQSPSHQQQSPQQNHQGHGMMSQMSNNHLVDTNQYGQMRHNTGYMNPMVDGHGMMGNGMHMQNPGAHGQMQASGPVMTHMTQDSHNHNRQMCIRNGCNNSAMTNPEWDEEYCSNECVVTHCRNVFTNWVSSNQQGNPNYGSSVKFHTPGNGSLGADGIPYVT